MSVIAMATSISTNVTPRRTLLSWTTPRRGGDADRCLTDNEIDVVMNLFLRLFRGEVAEPGANCLRPAAQHARPGTAPAPARVEKSRFIRT
jgi:hypothetical protein